MASADLRDDLSCSICLNIYRDPVSLTCGHNFCRVCIDRVLDTQEASGVYTCPECREEFQERPKLYYRRSMHNVANKFLNSQPVQQDTLGIYCTYCVDSPVPAIKCCLLCECSLCDKHLRVHAKSPKHILSDPTNTTGNRKCSIHNKIVEYYCTKDGVCICVYCIAFGEHKFHPVEKLDEAIEKKKEKLRKDPKIIASNQAWAEQQVQNLKERKTAMEEKAAGVTERVTAKLRDVRRELEALEQKITSEISMKEEKISQSVSNLIQPLEIKKEELSRKMRHIEELCNTTDPITVLRDQISNEEDVCHTEQEDHMDTKIPSEGDFHEGPITDRLHKLSDLIKDIPIWIQRADNVLLDEETASNNIQISGDLKTVSRLSVALNRPETPKRFKYYQVQSRRRFSSGRHCWELDTSNSRSWRVGLCYPSMSRNSFIGGNKDSWGLQKHNDEYNKVHENKRIPLLHKPTSHKLRIFLNYEAGKISFCELSDPIRHLHSFTTTFTEPLHLVIGVWDGSITITN